MSAAPDCRAFRACLEQRLAGRALAHGLTELAWHEHLFGCADCRALLEREEALEMLLASLPEPRLPHDLAQRVLARLRQHDEAELDDLLALDVAPVAPANLAALVLAGLARARAGELAPAPLSEDQLDRLLERVEVSSAPAHLAARTLERLARERLREVDLGRLEHLLERAGPVEIPPGLAERVLERLESERGRPLLRASFVRRRWIAAAAAALVVAGVWALVPGARRTATEDSPRAQDGPLVQGPDEVSTPQIERGLEDDSADLELALLEPEPELLALFDLLTEDLLWEDGGDLDLAASISIAGREELLLEFGSAPAAPEPPSDEDEG